MNTQNRFSKSWTVIMLVLGALALMACTPDTLQVGIEPTPTLTPLPTIAPTPTPSVESYVNNAYGFAFRVPSNWTLVEEPNVVKLSQGTVTLRIAFRWATEFIDISGGRTGMPGGDILYRDKVSFLGEMIPVQLLEYERKAKMVFYGGPGLPMEIGDLVISIYLEDMDSADYEAVELSQELQDQAKAIVESFQAIEATTQPPIWPPATSSEDSLIAYTEDEYLFSFQYPAAWTLQEQGSHFVEIGTESLSLYIGYMWRHESLDIWSRTAQPATDPAADLESRQTVTFLGVGLARQVLVHEGLDRVVYYNGAPSQISMPDVLFSISLHEIGSGPVGISAEQQAVADQIVESFVQIEQKPPVTDLPVVGWYGSVHSLPAEANFDDYLSLVPEGAGEVGLVGATAEMDSAIAEMRDAEPPNKQAHFWGALSCGVSDYGGCQLVVSDIRPIVPGEYRFGDAVEGWEGILISNHLWVLPDDPFVPDDAFVLAGNHPVHYGIVGNDPAINLLLVEAYRDTGIGVRIWGDVACGAPEPNMATPDVNYCQIHVSRLEEASSRD